MTPMRAFVGFGFVAAGLYIIWGRGRHDLLSGGLADEMEPEDFEPVALRKGTLHEMEHTRDAAVAQEIAMDHLAEDPRYYEKLERMER